MKIKVPILLIIFILWFNNSVHAEKMIYTIQTRSCLTIEGAQKIYDKFLKSLPDNHKNHLRIEVVGKYFTVRTGKYSAKDQATDHLNLVKDIIPGAIILKAFIKKERIKKIHVLAPKISEIKTDKNIVNKKLDFVKPDTEKEKITHSIHAEKRIYTIQARSCLTIKEAQKIYDKFLKSLPDNHKNHLRIEVVGKYFTVRTGKYSAKDQATDHLNLVKDIIPGAIILKTFIKKERIKKIHVLAPKISEIKTDKNIVNKKLDFVKPDTEKEKITHSIEKEISVKIKTNLWHKSNKRLRLIQARIYSKNGLAEKAIKLYRKLVNEYPEDKKIRKDYIEALVNLSAYDLALFELNRSFSKKDIGSLWAQRILTRIYSKQGKFRWVFPVYENILRESHQDPSIWSDYAHASQDAREWSRALNCFCRDLELNPENIDSLRNIQNILKEHRLNLQVNYFSSHFEDNSQIDTFTFHYEKQLTPKTYVNMNFDNIRLYQPFYTDETLKDITIYLGHAINPRWKAGLGGSLYSGLGDGESLLLSLACNIRDNASLQAYYTSKHPWFDPVIAAGYEGQFEEKQLSFNWNFTPSWGICLDVRSFDYSIKDVNNYGTKRTFSGVLSRRLLEYPFLTASYSFYRSLFSYNGNNRQVDMVESEGIHSISCNFELFPSPSWSYILSGGYRRDVLRSLDSWYVISGINLLIGNRFETGIKYEYNTEASTMAGGTIETIRIDMKYIF